MENKQNYTEKMHEIFMGAKRVFVGFAVFAFCLSVYFGISAILSHYFHETNTFIVEENAVEGMRVHAQDKKQEKSQEIDLLESKIEQYNIKDIRFLAFSVIHDPFEKILRTIRQTKSYSNESLLEISKIHNAINNFLDTQIPKEQRIFADSSIHYTQNDEAYPFIAIQLIHADSPQYLYYLGEEKDSFVEKMRNYMKGQKINCTIHDEQTFIYITYKNQITHVIRLRELEEKIGAISLLDRQKFFMTVILDDAGENLPLAKKCMDLPFPVILSIWPKATHSVSIAVLAHEKGLPVFLHQPMEALPRNGREVAIGNGGITTSMSYATMREIMLANISSLPFVQGVNNHMGSKFTQDKKAVEKFLRVIREIKPFFLLLDSITVNNTKFYAIAKENNFFVTKRDFFIDNSKNVKDIENELERAYKIAQKHKRVIVIGHVRESTYQALKNWQQYNDINLVFTLPAMF